MQIKRIPLSELKVWGENPRLVTDKRFKALCKSLENDPEFMELRPVLATKDGTIYGGNQRYRAAEHLGWKDIPAVISDIPESLAKERAIKDNNQFGEWQEQELQEIIASLDTLDVSTLGFTEEYLAELSGEVPNFEPVGIEEQGRLDEKKKVICPQCSHEFTP
jgi:hypothetical protein